MEQKRSLKKQRKNLFRERGQNGRLPAEREAQGKRYLKKMHPMKASYTVEASFLMPLIFFVLAGLLICTFYLHDKAVMQAAVCEVVSAGSNAATEKEQKQVIAGLKEAFTRERLMGTKSLSRRENTGKKVSAEWSGNYPVPGLAIKYFSSDSLPVRASWSSEKIQPADIIRKIRGVRKLIDGGTE